MQIWQIYRSRWCARYWQELGIRVIPSIQTIIPTLTLETLPTPCPVIAIQCRTLGNEEDRFERFGEFITSCVEVLQPQTVVIYGGKENWKRFHGFVPKDVDYSLLDSIVTSRKRRRRLVDSKTLPAMGVHRPLNKAGKLLRGDD
jgi:hypothetical protein